MNDDPVIDEIRRVRHLISAEFDHDPAKLGAHYQEYQKQFAGRLIQGPAELDALDALPSDEGSSQG